MAICSGPVRRVALACSLSALIACGDSGPTDPLVAIAGTYRLQAVNGNPLPTTVQVGSTISTTFVAEEITIKVGNTWIGTRTGSTKIGAETINTSGTRFGSWALVNGSELHIMDTTQQNPSFRDGTWSVNTITLTNPPYVWVFTRVR